MLATQTAPQPAAISARYAKVSVDHLDFLTADDQRLLSQIQGRTYANMNLSLGPSALP